MEGENESYLVMLESGRGGKGGVLGVVFLRAFFFGVYFEGVRFESRRFFVLYLGVLFISIDFGNYCFKRTLIRGEGYGSVLATVFFLFEVITGEFFRSI